MIPLVSFYFIRHGETDWNKQYQELCSDDNIVLNATGIEQINRASNLIDNLGITHITSSPLMRAKQTAQIINCKLGVLVEYNEGLCGNSMPIIVGAMNQILQPNKIALIVSHGQVYRILIEILNAHTDNANVKNCGLYYFVPKDEKNWVVSEINAGND